MYPGGEGGHLRRRGGSESESHPPTSYVVSDSSNSFQVTRENISPHPSPNPRAFKGSVEAMSVSCSSRDRTNEFKNTLRSLKGRSLNNGHLKNGRPGASGALAKQNSDFLIIAKSIGKDITSTFTKLEKLTLLAKRKTIFDDKPVEIQELTYIIKHDLATLNEQIGKLQTIAKAQRKTQGSHQQSHSTSVVVQLQSKLATMSSNFKSVLEVRTENLKSQKSRAEQFSLGSVTSSMPQSASMGYHAGSVLAMEDEVSGGGDAVIDMGMGGQSALVTQDTDSYYSSRADTMHTIESTIVELGGIFTQLATMVKEQEEMVQRIDSNVDDTALNVEMGHNEILKYFQSVTSNRWLMVKIFGVLIFFFLIFIIFMA